MSKVLVLYYSSYGHIETMAQAVAEMSHYDEYDYLIVNDDFETSLQQLASIICAERTRLAAQRLRHADLLDRLLAR